MTADQSTHRERVNPTGAHDTDVQTVVTMLPQCDGATKIRLARELTEHLQLRLPAVLEKLKHPEIINFLCSFRNSREGLPEEDNPKLSVIADGSGMIDDYEVSITANDIFELLASPRRRALIKQISELTPIGEETETHLELRELATMMAGAQTGVDTGELSNEERHRTYVSLTQVHAESLEEHDVATYHRRVKKITPTADIHALATIIEAVEAAAESEV